MGEYTTDGIINELRARVTAGYGEEVAAVLDGPRATPARIVARVAWTAGHECGMKQVLTQAGEGSTTQGVQVETRYFTIRDFASLYPWPSAGAIRRLIDKGDENGFDSVVKRIGGRVLLDEAAFHRWVASGGEG